MNKILCILSIPLFLTSIANSQSLVEAFASAGANMRQLQLTLDYYKNLHDNEKYRAATFLIENMPIHQSIGYTWVDSNGKTVHFSEFDYADADEARIAFKKLTDTLRLKPRRRIVKDVKIITSEYLIRQIDMAFTEWNQNPWSQTYSFEIFCEYILPYRSLVESLEEWREDYHFMVKNAPDRAEFKSDPVDVCTQVLYELKDFTFVNKRPDPTPILSPQQMLFRRQGSCPDLANLAVLASRAIGIAATFDFTPHYAASSNRHYWNTVIDAQGRHIPFNSNAVSSKEDFLPYTYNVNRKRLAKVFRKTYSIQKEALASQVKSALIPTGFLQDKNLKDVTSEYVRTGAIKIDAKPQHIDQVPYAFVFNLGKWKVIDWGSLQSDQFVFENLGVDIVYLSGAYNNKRYVFYPYPILLNSEGNQFELKPDFTNTFSADLTRSNEFKRDYIDFNTLEIEDRYSYQLQYWSDGWQNLGESKAEGSYINFKNLPSNALFRLLPENPDGFERIFTIDPENYMISWY